jgi:hypothetical protein
MRLRLGCRLGVVLAIGVVEAVVIYDIVITGPRDRLEVRGAAGRAVGGISSSSGGGNHGVDGIDRLLQRGNCQGRGRVNGRRRDRGEIGSGLDFRLGFWH